MTLFVFLGRTKLDFNVVAQCPQESEQAFKRIAGEMAA
jgi:hypothetical protein